MKHNLSHISFADIYDNTHICLTSFRFARIINCAVALSFVFFLIVAVFSSAVAGAVGVLSTTSRTSFITNNALT